MLLMLLVLSGRKCCRRPCVWLRVAFWSLLVVASWKEQVDSDDEKEPVLALALVLL